jgi:hypothetical protein
MVHYQKKYSVYVQKNNDTAQQKEDQPQLTLQLDLKTAAAATSAAKAGAYQKVLPH